MQVSVVRFRPWAPSTQLDFESAWLFPTKSHAKKTESNPVTSAEYIECC
jgi:hypothetical protein